jgi:stage II sporulation protein D
MTMRGLNFRKRDLGPCRVSCSIESFMTCAPRILAAVAAAIALACALPSAAGAETRFTIRGAGFGHGVGMSQYGAFGMAKNGWSHRQILAHYYTGTALGVVDPAQPVRVLLGGRSGVTRFTGATVAGGRRLKPTSTYGARRRADGGVDLLSPKGRRLAAVAAPLRIAGAEAVAVEARGS